MFKIKTSDICIFEDSCGKKGCRDFSCKQRKGTAKIEMLPEEVVVVEEEEIETDPF